MTAKTEIVFYRVLAILAYSNSLLMALFCIFTTTLQLLHVRLFASPDAANMHAVTSGLITYLLGWLCTRQRERAIMQASAQAPAHHNAASQT